jgi:hypothetical protein
MKANANRIMQGCVQMTAPPAFNKLFRAFALRRTGLVNEIKNKLQYT